MIMNMCAYTTCPHHAAPCEFTFPAQWDEFGKKAGFIRNEQMHRYIASKQDRGVIAFWDGESKGTFQSFDLSKKYNNQIRVIKYKNIEK